MNLPKRLKAATEVDEDKPGLGLYYCVACAKYFRDSIALTAHEKQKPHKRRLKMLMHAPHDQVHDFIVSSKSLHRKQPTGQRALDHHAELSQL